MFVPALVRPVSFAIVMCAAVPMFAQDYDWGKKMFDRHDVKFGSVARVTLDVRL